jgi:hypothetical protein
MSASLPLLELAAGGKPRPRRERLPVPKESELQIATARLLDAHLLPDWRASHFPAGESRGRGLDAVITGARLKRYGLKKGWPDVQLVSPVGRYHGLELKRPGGELTEEEEDFRKWALAHGVPHVVAWRIDQVHAALDKWGCLRVTFARRAAG